MTLSSMLKKCRVILGVAMLAVVASVILHARPVAAGDNNETYTWVDYRTIKISGGDTVTDDVSRKFPQLNRASLSVDQGGAGLTGDQIGLFGANSYINVNGKKCVLSYKLYIYKDTTKGSLWAPPPYKPSNSAVPKGYPDLCENNPETYSYLQSHFHDQFVTISGTRPGNPSAPERPEEKTFRVTVLAPDPLSSVPATDTIYIYTGDGKTQLKSLSGPFQDDSGQADWPPEQTPASLVVTFQDLDPGNYIVCDTYVAKNCTDPSKLAPGQKVTKKKYEPGHTTIGAQYQTPDKKRINVHVNYNLKVPCGSSVDVNPVMVEVTGPTGDNSKVVDKQTNAGHASANVPGETNALCTKKVSVGLDVVFDDVAPGEYKICTTGAPCVTATKNDGEALNVTLEITTEQTPPPDQKVCTSGDGVAGVLAWIICPATQLIASATEFFENNIIIPFMTVSPLTTNNSNPVYILWQNFRDVANVGFVILLFISIFSIALSKYGLMRVLPRLLIVALGINLSYFVVAFIIDAFNIFGAGISQLITAALQQAGTTQLNTGTSAGAVRSIFTLGGAALLTILLSGGAALGWLFSFLGLAALVVVMVVIVLIIRQLAIIVLVVLSPIAILLYLLPNTEGFFKKWRQLLLQLLIMYPMIVLLFAAGKIFGIILQQPDFKIGGDGVSDGVGQAVRVILQFLVYVIPLVFLPATFAASGVLMSKGYALLANNKRFRQWAQRPGQALTENVVKPKRQELITRAARRGGRIGQLAGMGMRRNFKREQRERELGRARQEYLSNQATNERFAASAAGIGGQQGATRVRANAVTALEKSRKEEIANEAAIFAHELRKLGLNTKEFNSQFSAFLEDPTKNIVAGTLRDANGNLRTIDLTQRQDLLRSALNSAAAAGEITTIEQARLSAGVDQSMLDDVIRSYDGVLKSKGGYHLATNFNLANGRAQGTQRDINIARLRSSFAAGGADIADMKASFVNATLKTIRDPATLAAMTSGVGALTPAERKLVRDNINTLLSSPDISGSAKNIDALRDIATLI